MAFGPIPPCSVYLGGNAGRAFGSVYDGVSTTGVQYQSGFGIAASIAADTNILLAWAMPWGALPAGTAKLILWARANATANAAKVNPKWVMSGSGDDPAAQTLSAEGTTTLTWTTAHQFLQATVVLDATTVVHSKFLFMRLVFETSGWTLAAKSLWVPWFIIE